MREVSIDEDGFYSATDIVDGEIVAGYGETYDEAVQDLKEAIQEISSTDDEGTDEEDDGVEINENSEEVETLDQDRSLDVDREHFGFDQETGSLTVHDGDLTVTALIKVTVTLANGEEASGIGETLQDAKGDLTSLLSVLLS